jgi:hypothetical protein
MKEDKELNQLLDLYSIYNKESTEVIIIKNELKKLDNNYLVSLVNKVVDYINNISKDNLLLLMDELEAIQENKDISDFEKQTFIISKKDELEKSIIIDERLNEIYNMIFTIFQERNNKNKLN